MRNIVYYVEVLNVEDDADVGVIQEQIEIAVALQLPFIDIEVSTPD